MIVREKPNLFNLFFILHGSVAPRITPLIIFISLLSALVTYLLNRYPESFANYSTAPFALFGVALSLFLGFRNNACYDRWWEARKDWGQLLVDTRSIARQAMAHIDESTESGKMRKRRLIRLTIAYGHALKHNLRNSDAWPEIEQYVDEKSKEELQRSNNLPDCLLRLMGRELAHCNKEGLLPTILVHTIEERLTSIANIQASCERIANTPLPFAYMLLVHRTAHIYCFMMPFGLGASLGMVTPLVCAVVAYTLFGLDALSEELEAPFTSSPNQLALSSISRTIEINLLEAMGETNLPEPIKPEGYHLL